MSIRFEEIILKLKKILSYEFLEIIIKYFFPVLVLASILP